MSLHFVLSLKSFPTGMAFKFLFIMSFEEVGFHLNRSYKFLITFVTLDFIRFKFKSFRSFEWMVENDFVIVAWKSFAKLWAENTVAVRNLMVQMMIFKIFLGAGSSIARHFTTDETWANNSTPALIAWIDNDSWVNQTCGSRDILGCENHLWDVFPRLTWVWCVKFGKWG